MPQTFANFIGGKWSPARSGKAFDDINPADATDVVGQFAQSDAADVQDAVVAARAAFAKWNAASVTSREAYLFKAAEIMEKRADEIGAALTREMGKTLKEAKGEVARAVQIIRFFAGEARRITGETYPSDSPSTFLYTLRVPLGVVAAVTPWNFPIAIPIWKIAPAMVYGNAVVLKVSKETPHLGVLIAQVFEQAGLPAGVLNVVTGPGSVVGEALLNNPDVAAVSYTGSCEIGARVAAACSKNNKKYQLEMGGQNPAIVLPDADLDQAVDAVIAGAFWSTGQKCTATSRTFVHEAVYDKFRSALVDKTKALKIGPGMDPATQMGPLINQAALDRILEGVETGKKQGGALATGGRRVVDADLAKGFFVEPTIFERVDPNSIIAQDEYFGPFLCLMKVKTLDEGIDLANGVKFGLSASIFTGDIGAAQTFIRRIQAGMVHVNSQTAGAEAHVPFGGMKASSNLVREQGRYAMDFYTAVKTVYFDPTVRKNW
jgi:aldehyde dehydrogenase (NAD+)